MRTGTAESKLFPPDHLIQYLLLKKAPDCESVLDKPGLREQTLTSAWGEPEALTSFLQLSLQPSSGILSSQEEKLDGNG